MGRPFARPKTGGHTNDLIEFLRSFNCPNAHLSRASQWVGSFSGAGHPSRALCDTYYIHYFVWRARHCSSQRLLTTFRVSERVKQTGPGKKEPESGHMINWARETRYSTLVYTTRVEKPRPSAVVLTFTLRRRRRSSGPQLRSGLFNRPFCSIYHSCLLRELLEKGAWNYSSTKDG